MIFSIVVIVVNIICRVIFFCFFESSSKMYVSSADKIHIDYSYDLFCAICEEDIQTVSEILHYFPLDFRFKRIRTNGTLFPRSEQYQSISGMNIVGVVVEYGNTEILKFVLDKGYDMYTWSMRASDISILMYKSMFYFFRESWGMKIIEPIVRVLSDYGYNWNRRYITEKIVLFQRKCMITAIVETIGRRTFQLFKLLLEVGSDPHQTIQIMYPNSHHQESLDYVIDNNIDNANADTKTQFFNCLESYRLTTSKLLYMHLFSLLSIIQNNEIGYQPHDYTAERVEFGESSMFEWLYRNNKSISKNGDKHEIFTTPHFIKLCRRIYENDPPRYTDIKAYKSTKYRNTLDNDNDTKMINNKPPKMHNERKNIIKNIHKIPHRRCYSIQQMHRSSKHKSK